MNMDYSKAFELLNQDTEKGRNEKAEKAVHDIFYNKGFRDGIAVLDKIRAEVTALKSHHINDSCDNGFQGCRIEVLDILDKYEAES